MNASNGAVPPTSTNTPDSTPVIGSGIGAWLENDHARLPLEAANQLATAADADDDLAGDVKQLIQARRRAALQRDTARLDVLDDDEMSTQRKQAKQIRRMQDRLDVLRVTSRIAQETRNLRARIRLVRIDAANLVWQAAAKARRVRLMDPTSRLATIYRTQVAASSVLIGLALIGIAWCAYGVGKALGGHWTMYGVEPLFSVPLLVIMTMHAIAAQNGTVFPPPPPDGAVVRTWRGRPLEYWRLLSIKLGSFTVTTVLNVAPVVPVLGHWRNATTLIAHLFPPALIILVVQLQPLVSSFLSRLLVSINLEIETTYKRLQEEEVALLDRARTINDLWESGALTSANPNNPHDRTAGPSVKAVQKRLGLGKEQCQAGVDAWHRAYGPRTN